MRNHYLKRLIILFFCLVVVICCSCPLTAGAKKPTKKYIIFSKCAPGKCVDVFGSSNDNRANVHLWDYMGNYNQQWYMEQNKSGYYTFQSVQSKKYLTIQGNSTKSGANVWQYDKNNTDSQQWELINDENGYCFIKSKLGTYLDVTSASSQNDTNIQVYDGNGTDAQLWKIIEVKEFKPLKDYTYTISSKVDTNMCLNVSGGVFSTNDFENVNLWKSGGKKQENQQWIFFKKDNGYYSIQAYHSGKMLDVEWGGSHSGTNIQQYYNNDTPAQHWKIVQSENDGYYYIISEISGKALDLKNAKAKNGQNIRQYNRNGTDAQQWSFTKSKKIQSKALVFKGNFLVYEISNIEDITDILIDQCKDIISKKDTNFKTLNSFDILPTSRFYTTDIAPSVPRVLSEEIRSGETFFTKWEQNGTKYSIYAYQMLDYWNMFIIETKKYSANIIFGIFLEEND